MTGLWNYAQHFALSDNSFGTTFGPSTPGALNVISGQTHGSITPDSPDEIVNGTIIGDPDPLYDDCSDADDAAGMSGRTIGDLLTRHTNPGHLPPTSVAMIGHSDQANHQYDLTDFWAAADVGGLPAVSFLEAAKYQDGHPGYSDPLDEQTWLVTTINHLEQLPSWRSTAVIIAWDDSDGWYDHAAPTIVNPSNDPATDAYSGPGDQSYDAIAGSLENLFSFSGPKARKVYLDPTTGEPLAAPPPRT